MPVSLYESKDGRGTLVTDNGTLIIDKATGRFSEGNQNPSDCGDCIASGIRLLGTFKCGNVRHMLILTENEKTAEVEDAKIFTIKKIVWARIELDGNAASKNDESLVKLLTTYDPCGYHFYSDDVDLHNATEETIEDDNCTYATNSWMRSDLNSLPKQFEKTIPHLIQGVAITVGNTTLITRKSPQNPGTRLLARGLCGSTVPANEAESTLYITCDDGRKLKYIFIRGTVPLNWFSERTLNKELEVVTLRRDADIGLKEYNERLEQKYKNKKIKFINLLRDTGVETSLCREMNSLSQTVHVNWHGISEKNGTEYAAATLLTTLKASLQEDCIFRVNCKDSLDRTNVACFYICVAVVSMFLKNDNPIMFKQASDILERKATIMALENVIPESLLCQLAEVVAHTGDTLATLYTGTAAQHSGPYRKYCNKSGSSNFLGLRRLLQSSLFDSEKHHQLHLWTGTDPGRKLWDVYPVVLSNNVKGNEKTHSCCLLTNTKSLSPSLWNSLHEWSSARIHRIQCCDSCLNFPFIYFEMVTCDTCGYLVCLECKKSPAIATCGEFLSCTSSEPPPSAYVSLSEKLPETVSEFIDLMFN